MPTGQQNNTFSDTKFRNDDRKGEDRMPELFTKTAMACNIYLGGSVFSSWILLVPGLSDTARLPKRDCTVKTSRNRAALGKKVAGKRITASSANSGWAKALYFAPELCAMCTSASVVQRRSSKVASGRAVLRTVCQARRSMPQFTTLSEEQPDAARRVPGTDHCQTEHSTTGPHQHAGRSATTMDAITSPSARRDPTTCRNRSLRHGILRADHRLQPAPRHRRFSAPRLLPNASCGRPSTPPDRTGRPPVPFGLAERPIFRPLAEGRYCTAARWRWPCSGFSRVAGARRSAAIICRRLTPHRHKLTGIMMLLLHSWAENSGTNRTIN